MAKSTIPEAKVIANLNKISKLEWLQLRQGGLTGTDAPAICGLSRFGNRLSVFANKTVEITEEDIQEESERFYWGHRQEKMIADEFRIRTGMTVRSYPWMLKNTVHPWLLANPDRIVVDGGEVGGLECKNVHEFMSKEWQGEDIPDTAAVQCHHYMMVTGLKFWWIAALIGGCRFVYRRIERDEDIMNDLFSVEEEFWGMVQKKIMPAIDGSDISSRVLKSLYHEAVSRAIPLPPEALTHAQGYKDKGGEEREARTQKMLHRNNLTAMLAENEYGIVEDTLVCWKKTEAGDRRFSLREITTPGGE